LYLIILSDNKSQGIEVRAIHKEEPYLPPPELGVGDGLLQWKAPGVEGNEAIADGPLLHRLLTKQPGMQVRYILEQIRIRILVIRLDPDPT
jgi:hypothetical protein